MMLTNRNGRSLSSTITMRGVIAVTLLVGMGSVATGIVLERSAKRGAEQTGTIVAEKIAADVQSRFERPIGTIAGMRDASSALQAAGLVDRTAHSRIIKATITGAPQLLATWIGWEANAFDGRDARYAGTAGHDQTGRFVPYWHRSAGGIALSPLEDYATPGAGDYYLVARRSGRPTIVEPYLYKVDGREVLMTSIALPILRSGRPVGVAGADIALDDMQKALRALKLPYGGQVSLVSGKGAYLYTNKVGLLGQSAGASAGPISMFDDPSLGQVMRVESPVALSGIDAGWRVRVDLPMRLVLADARTVEWTLFLSTLAMIAMLALILRMTARNVVGRPLEQLASEMKALADGDLAPPGINPASASEIMHMQHAVQIFRENAIHKDKMETAKAKTDAEQRRVVDTVSIHLSALSKGDLNTRITADFPSEYTALKENFNDALAQLDTLIGQVSESVTAISTGSGEIAQASEDLARRTESNAASLEETTASIMQIDGRLKTSTTAGIRTVERADQAIGTVSEGRAVAEDAVQAMGRVADSAKGIDNVIEGLDKIAFQTRVLAMNAAVEAGRAGDAGRGFAVVADLVSALAMRAEEEAKRARDQLTLTQCDIVTAVEAVTKVDDALARITGDVSQVHDLLATMATDNQAQSAAITEISMAIGVMDQSTQQNAAMVEETSAAARNLAGEVTSLADHASRFKFSKDDAGRPVGSYKSDFRKPHAYVDRRELERPLEIT